MREFAAKKAERAKEQENIFKQQGEPTIKQSWNKLKPEYDTLLALKASGGRLTPAQARRFNEIKGELHQLRSRSADLTPMPEINYTSDKAMYESYNKLYNWLKEKHLSGGLDHEGIKQYNYIKEQLQQMRHKLTDNVHGAKSDVKDKKSKDDDSITLF